jgi:hypothetical protein
MSLSTKQITDLKALGVDKIVSKPEPAKGLVLLYGREKRGKTHFPFTGPDPVMYIDIDIGSRGMVDKFLKMGKNIYRVPLIVPYQLGKMGSEDVKSHAQKQLNKLYKAYDYALSNSVFRLIVCDTSTELYNLFLLAHLGKAAKIMPELRGMPNSEFSAYIANEATGNSIPAGYNNMTNLVDAILEAERVDPKRRAKGLKPKPGEATEPVFKISVRDHRIDIGQVGNEFILSGEDSEAEALGVTNYQLVMASLYPKTKYGDWA